MNITHSQSGVYIWKMSDQQTFIQAIKLMLNINKSNNTSNEIKLNSIKKLLDQFKVKKQSYKAYEACIEMLENNEMELFHWFINNEYAFDIKDKTGYNLFARVLELGDLDILNQYCNSALITNRIYC